MNRLETSAIIIRGSVREAFPEFTTIWCNYTKVGKGKIKLMFTFFSDKGYSMRVIEFNNFVQVSEDGLTTQVFDEQISNTIKSLKKLI
ncbi:MAG: hypothetical protein H0X63_00005 [Flavobacteriales bacterium]|nr:hypothetical protein [Flavobacteriales bacterium]